MKRIFKVLLIFMIVIISAFALFLATLALFEYRPADVTALDVTYQEDADDYYLQLDTDIKVITFNTGYASLSETESFVMDGGDRGIMETQEAMEENLEGISSILTREDADIVLLQEVDTDSHRSYNVNQNEYYLDILGGNSVLAYNYRCIFVPFPFDLEMMMGKVNSGIATYSDYYFDEAERIQLPGNFSWPVSMANLKRCMLVTRFQIDGSDQELVIINVHLSAYDDGTMRVQETQALQTLMASEYEAGNYVVVGGDFNQTFPDGITDDGDYLYELRNADYWQAPALNDDLFSDTDFSFATDATSPTCRLLNQAYDTVNLENNQYYLIDGFIVTNNVSIESITTINEDFVYSDHNPVTMIFKLNS